MQSRASIRKHPVHPMLIVFPIASWVFSLICDLIYHGTEPNLFWKDMALYTMLFGITTALLAAIPGFIDYLTITNRQVRRVATTHMILNLLVVAIFIFNLGVRLNTTPERVFPVIVSVIGIAFLLVSGWLGGSLVYVHRMGVTERAEETPRERAA